ncbi:Protein FAM136A [Sciurus carolinensis]|uniref:Protein FAM136A n=1 Tax=Sciurus carolinensis TaxID=30640 RepID=A0AA41NES8_SCICA|nr:Protein FAM136A [Sciurus carolinensis]
MAKVQQIWVQEVVDSMVKSVERDNIWKMQGLMFWCSTSCCEDSQDSMQQQVKQQLDSCVSKCMDDQL